MSTNWISFQFISIVFLMAGLMILATRWAGRLEDEPASTSRRWTVGASVVIGLYLGVGFVLAQGGTLTDFSHMPSPFMKLLFTGTMINVMLSAVSPWGKRMVKGFSLQALFGFQVFRILVEALLMVLYKSGIAPIQMTVEGRNLDIITGLLALAVLILVKRDQLSKIAYAILNFLGLGLLLNVVIVGFLSLPTPFQVFTGDNTWITRAPFVWLPVFLVQIALSGHILSFRKLLMERKAIPLPKLAQAQS